MKETNLTEKENDIASSYRSFLAKVKESFNAHCDEIKEYATAKFNVIPESDQEGRKKVLAEQKAELDKTLSELKELLAKKGAEVRSQLEKIANLRDQQGFDLEAELKEVEKDAKGENV